MQEDIIFELLTNNIRCNTLSLVRYFSWNLEKNEKLKSGRGIGFEEVVMAIENGDVVQIIEHPNKTKYPNQRIMFIKIRNYIYLVPCVEDNEKIFFKTIIPSSKTTKQYLLKRK